MNRILLPIAIVLSLSFLWTQAFVFAAGEQFVVGLSVVSDAVPPSVPAGLAAPPVSASQINLSWTASTDNVAVGGYVIYRDAAPVGTTTGTSYSDGGLTASTLYTYTVEAYDTTLNYSGQSGSASATTDAGGGGGGGGDTTPPSVASFSPTNGATGIAPTATLVMTMTELVNKVSGNIIVRRTGNDSVFESISVSSAAVSVSGSVVTITLTAPLESATAYYVTVDAGAFTDQSGNSFAGFSGNSTWAFATVDVVAPVISGVSASTTQTSATISFSTNEPALATLEWGTSTSYGLGSASEVVLLTVHAMGIGSLNPSTLYYYRLTAQDGSGNVSTPSTGTFTTLTPPPPPDTTPPANPSSFTGTPSLTSIA